MPNARGAFADAGMAVFLLQRILFGMLAVLAAASVAFVLIWHAPGGPAVGLAGEYGAPGYLEEVAARYGLDRPGVEVWRDWIVRLTRGDLGVSWREQRPVAALILERLPLTAVLVVSAALLAVLIGTALGAWAAASPRRWPVALFAGFHAVPSFILAQALVLLLAVWAGLLPVQGIADSRAPATDSLALLVERARHLVLPVLAIALHQLCFTALLVRAGAIEQMRLPYATAARARGLSQAQTLRRHALPNALLPVVALTGVRVGNLVGGALAIEVAFGLPGVGRLAVSAALARDHPVLVGTVVIACAVAWLANLLADLLAQCLDPRISRPAP